MSDTPSTDTETGTALYILIDARSLLLTTQHSDAEGADRATRRVTKARLSRVRTGTEPGTRP